jgi:predicted dehydrogenase
MSKVGLGIVGGGTIAQRVLRHLVQPDVAERVSLTAICDPVADRARAAAEKFGIARWFSDYQELLACDDVDAVTIASPINFHFEQVRQALLASKHVHCNKAMATTGAEAKELTRLARDHNLRLVPSPGEMLRPHNQYIKERFAGQFAARPLAPIMRMKVKDRGTMFSPTSIRLGTFANREAVHCTT